MRSIYDVVKRPIISEKSTALSEVASRYTFEVSPEANKLEIAHAVQELFKVKVLAVRTIHTHGKVKVRGRARTKLPNRKKAIVTLAEGQKIDYFQTQ